MDSDRLAAGLIASGLLIFVAAGLVTPQGLYQEPADTGRIRIIAENRTRFLAAQVLWASWLVVPAAGFVLLSRHLNPPATWLPTAGAAAIIAGAVAAAIFVVLQTVDPQRFWLAGEGAWVSRFGAWLITVAAALFGVAMIQSSGWAVAGTVLAVYALIAAGALVLSAPSFFVAAAFCLAALAPALLLLQGRPT